ncbi:MAG: CBS domain-containing protein [Sandaracinaceae bacterium]
MSPFPFSIHPDATLRDARAMMGEHDIHHLPVTGPDGKILGMISDADVLLAGQLAGEKAGDALVETVYAREPYVVDLHAELSEVVGHMAEQRIGSAIVTRRGKLAGILTHTDVCRVLAELLDEISPPPETGRVA